MTHKYYLYSYLCYFRSMNIFGYLFGKYVAFQYIQIIVRYILQHPIYSDIRSRPFYDIGSSLNTTLQYITLHYNGISLQYNIIQCNTIHYNTLYYTGLLYTALHQITVNNHTLPYRGLHYPKSLTKSHYTTLHYDILQYYTPSIAVLHCTILL